MRLEHDPLVDRVRIHPRPNPCRTPSIDVLGQFQEVLRVRVACHQSGTDDRLGAKSRSDGCCKGVPLRSVERRDWRWLTRAPSEQCDSTR